MELGEYLTRINYGRWTRKITEWRPRDHAFPSRGRSPTRWSDDLKRIKTNWLNAAQDRGRWKSLREACGPVPCPAVDERIAVWSWWT